MTTPAPRPDRLRVTVVSPGYPPDRGGVEEHVAQVSRRLAEIPGIGPLLASALVAHVPNPRAFSSGRNLAAWIGLVPKQNSSGGKERLGRRT